MNFDWNSFLVILKILGVIVTVISVLLKIIEYYPGDSNFSDSNNRASDYTSKALVYRNAISIRPDPDFQRDVDRLFKGIELQFKNNL